MPHVEDDRLLSALIQHSKGITEYECRFDVTELLDRFCGWLPFQRGSHCRDLRNLRWFTMRIKPLHDFIFPSFADSQSIFIRPASFQALMTTDSVVYNNNVDSHNIVAKCRKRGFGWCRCEVLVH